MPQDEEVDECIGQLEKAYNSRDFEEEHACVIDEEQASEEASNDEYDSEFSRRDTVTLRAEKEESSKRKRQPLQGNADDADIATPPPRKVRRERLATKHLLPMHEHTM